MKHCTNCGNKIGENAKFCGKCGAKINVELNKEISNSLSNAGNVDNIHNESVASKHVLDAGIVQIFLSRNGRLNRLRYFKRIAILSILAGLINGLMRSVMLSSVVAHVVISLAIAWPYYCLDVRRLHDLGKGEMLAGIRLGLSMVGAISTFYMMEGSSSDAESSSVVYLVCLSICLFIGLYLLFAKGTRGENQYGPDPLDK